MNNLNLKEKKRCKYQKIHWDKEVHDAYSDFLNYISIHHPKLMKTNNSLFSEVKVEENLQVKEEFDNLNKFPQQKIVDLFVEYSQTNIFKNIVYAFQKHISELKDNPLQEIYQKSMLEQWDLDYVQLRVYQNFKTFKKFNLKTINLIKSEKLSKVFYIFLQNAEEFWVNQSKLTNKSIHQDAINLLIDIYNSSELTQLISFSVKHTKSLFKKLKPKKTK